MTLSPACLTLALACSASPRGLEVLVAGDLSGDLLDLADCFLARVLDLVAHAQNEVPSVLSVRRPPSDLTGLRPSPTRHAVHRCRFEGKLSQGPAVRWADRHHSLRR